MSICYALLSLALLVIVYQLGKREGRRCALHSNQQLRNEIEILKGKSERLKKAVEEQNKPTGG